MDAAPPDTRTVLITGANKGIGFETARQLAGRGWRVVIGARKKDAGAKAAAQIAKEGGLAGLIEIDVSNSESIRSAAADFGKQFDRLNVLIICSA